MSVIGLTFGDDCNARLVITYLLQLQRFFGYYWVFGLLFAYWINYNNAVPILYSAEYPKSRDTNKKKKHDKLSSKFC